MAKKNSLPPALNEEIRAKLMGLGLSEDFVAGLGAFLTAPQYARIFGLTAMAVHSAMSRGQIQSRELFGERRRRIPISVVMEQLDRASLTVAVNG